ncbi:MAG: histidine phosphatase family protein [Gammaproteobacteria bacterium]|nr:histidine phosphatase family protein [Gammaproteobacteria bacterium]
MGRSQICNRRLRSQWISGLVLGLLSLQVFAQQANLLSDQELVKALRTGGYNLYFRHEATDWSQSDRIIMQGDWLTCNPQRVRQLSQQGRARAVATGEAMRKLGIPVSRVLASPYCRTLETASLLKLAEVEPTNDVINMRIANYFGGRAAVVTSAQALLARPPAAGSNVVIVSHGNVAQAATPAYPGEGEAVVFQPDGTGGFRLVGRLTPADWQRLAAMPK